MDSFKELNVKDLIFKKTTDKIGEYKKNYIPLNIKGQKIKIKLENVKIPFGTEKYNKLTILNIEISPQKSNDHLNIHAIISGFEDEFIENTNIKDNSVKKETDGKGYYKNIRDSKDGYIIRCHLFNNPEVYSLNNGTKNLMIINDIQKTKANVVLELATLWITENNYGIIWRVVEIEILYNY